MTTTTGNITTKRITTGRIILTVSLTLNLFFAAFALGSTALADVTGTARPLAQLKQTWTSLTPAGQDMIRETLLSRKDKMKANAAQGRAFQLEFAAIIEGDTVDESALDALIEKRENFAATLRDDLRSTLRTTLTALPAADRHTIAAAIRSHEPKAEILIDKLMTKLQESESQNSGAAAEKTAE